MRGKYRILKILAFLGGILVAGGVKWVLCAQTLPPELERIVNKLETKFGLKSGEMAIVVLISEQRLYLLKDGKILRKYAVSTSKYGIGKRAGSYKTPLGTHRIEKKIGGNAKMGEIFVARQRTGKVAEIYTDSSETGLDLVTTRILWLRGLEPGVNAGDGIDSFSRCIYIHGTHEEGLIGRPASKGCIRMKNRDIIELFKIVPVGTLVEIHK